MLAAGFYLVVVVLYGTPASEPPAPTPLRPSTSSTTTVPLTSRVVPRGACPPGDEAYAISETEWLCVHVEPPPTSRSRP